MDKSGKRGREKSIIYVVFIVRSKHLYRIWEGVCAQMMAYIELSERALGHRAYVLD